MDSRTENSGGRVLGKVVQMSTTKCGKGIKLYSATYDVREGLISRKFEKTL